MTTMIRSSSTVIGKSQTKEGILMLHQTLIMIQPQMINALENLTAKISVQPLAQAALGSIQESDGNDKAARIPWLNQVELVAERTGKDSVEVGISS